MPQGFPFSRCGAPAGQQRWAQASEQQSTYKELVLEDRLTVPEGFRPSCWRHGVIPSATAASASTTITLVLCSTHGPGVDDGQLRIHQCRALGAGLRGGGGSAPALCGPCRVPQASDGVIDCTALPAGDRRLQQIRAVADEAMTDLGIGVMTLQRMVRANGSGRRGPRIDASPASAVWMIPAAAAQHGPAAAVFRASSRQGYDDGLGDRIIGTFANCGGGTTPWGTVLSAEENFQSQVPEPVHADGSAVAPTERRLSARTESWGTGNVYGLAGNKYGWMVEVDPTSAGQTAVAHGPGPLSP
ncbi:MAG: hypothetical protein CM15mP77_3750 [Synechococcus sp.]|nr:MAG: hypothetical protein CM15mP77_3750 [Synechococcus sp.]